MAYYNPITTISSVGSGNLPIPVTIASTTAPTTRENGGDLKQGDNWYNPTTEEDHIWIGTTASGTWRLVGTSDTPNYTLPVASSSVLGGIKIGTGITVNGIGVVSVATAPVLSPGATLWGSLFQRQCKCKW